MERGIPEIWLWEWWTGRGETQVQPSVEEVQQELGTELSQGPVDLLSWETSLYAFISHLFQLNSATSMAIFRADLCPGDSLGSL